MVPLIRNSHISIRNFTFVRLAFASYQITDSPIPYEICYVRLKRDIVSRTRREFAERKVKLGIKFSVAVSRVVPILFVLVALVLPKILSTFVFVVRNTQISQILSKQWVFLKAVPRKGKRFSKPSASSATCVKKMVNTKLGRICTDS